MSCQGVCLFSSPSCQGVCLFSSPSVNDEFSIDVAFFLLQDALVYVDHWQTIRWHGRDFPCNISLSPNNVNNSAFTLPNGPASSFFFPNILNLNISPRHSFKILQSNTNTGIHRCEQHNPNAHFIKTISFQSYQAIYETMAAITNICPVFDMECLYPLCYHGSYSQASWLRTFRDFTNIERS